MDPKFTEFLLISHFFWHWVSFFLFSSIKIINVIYDKKRKKEKANVSATYGGPLQCHKLKDKTDPMPKKWEINKNSVKFTVFTAKNLFFIFLFFTSTNNWENLKKFTAFSLIKRLFFNSKICLDEEAIFQGLL